MKILLICCAALAVLWWQHPEVYRKAGAMVGLTETRQASTGTEALLFVVDRCKPCEQAADLLDERGANFRQVNLDSDADAVQMLEDAGGGNSVPVLVIGDNRLDGFNEQTMLGFVATHQDASVLSDAERRAAAQHFDANGTPRLVMYGTDWCPHCKRARTWMSDSGIDWLDRDPEKDEAAGADFSALGSGGYPTFFVGYQRVQGFDKKSVLAALSQ